jgi:hypothetical protein
MSEFSGDVVASASNDAAGTDESSSSTKSPAIVLSGNIRASSLLLLTLEKRTF